MTEPAISHRQTVTITVDSANPGIRGAIRRAIEAAPGLTLAPSTDVELSERLVGTTTSSPINKKKLLDLVVWVAGEKAKQDLGLPSEWNQRAWLKVTPGLDAGPQITATSGTQCGTACCIAGKVALDSGAFPAAYRNNGIGGLVAADDPNVRLCENTSLDFVIPAEGGDAVGVSDQARAVLGLTQDQAGPLFAGENTYDDVVRIVGDLLREAEKGETTWVSLSEYQAGEAAPVVSEPVVSEPPLFEQGRETRYNVGDRVRDASGQVYECTEKHRHNVRFLECTFCWKKVATAPVNALPTF